MRVSVSCVYLSLCSYSITLILLMLQILQSYFCVAASVRLFVGTCASAPFALWRVSKVLLQLLIRIYICNCNW
jgi:hypothetical protein